MDDYLKCEVCGKRIDRREEQKAKTDMDGFIHLFCVECFKDPAKRDAALSKNPFRK